MIARLLSTTVPVAIAHRGGSALRPENTLPAFEHAVELGVDAIECDVHLSRDGEAVVIHDATLNRTTDATGPVAALTADELARVDAGFRFGDTARFPFRGQGHGVVSLTRVLARCPAVPVVIEIKGHAPALAHRVLDVIHETESAGRVIVGGFSAIPVSVVRQRAPELVTSASQPEVQSALRRAWVRLPPRRTGYRVFQVPVRLRGQTVLTAPFVRVVRRAGIPVHAWVVDNETEMETLLAWGVSGLISDRPDRAVAVVKRCSTLHA